jgi:hypothetical protein
MVDDKEESDDFIDAFREQLRHVDDLVPVVLNGHLAVEMHLDDFLDHMFFHPSYIEKAGLSFYHKLHIARAYSELGHTRPEWDLMLALNSVRNKIAHRGMRKELKVDLGKFRKLLPQAIKDVKVEDLNPRDLIVHTVAMCSGYLVFLRDQLRELQGLEPLDD